MLNTYKSAAGLLQLVRFYVCNLQIIISQLHAIHCIAGIEFCTFFICAYILEYLFLRYCVGIFQEHELKLIKGLGDGNRIATALLYVSFIILAGENARGINYSCKYSGL